MRPFRGGGAKGTIEVIDWLSDELGGTGTIETELSISSESEGPAEEFRKFLGNSWEIRVMLLQIPLQPLHHPIESLTESEDSTTQFYYANELIPG